MRKARGSEGQARSKKRPCFIWDLRPTTRRPRKADGREAEVPLKRTLLAFAAVLAFAGTSAAAEKYSVTDAGGFGPTGRFVEFSSRYQWASYQAEFDFSVDLDQAQLTRRSKLKIEITRRDGRVWKYVCRSRDIAAHIVPLYSAGTSVLVECRVNPRKFAKAVGLDVSLVGEPTLVFQVLIKEGKARAGLQKGFYILETEDTRHGSIQAYATPRRDPSALAVLFASSQNPELTSIRILSRYR